MSLSTQISGTLTNLHGFSASVPRTVTWSAPEGLELEVDFTAVDSMSCSLRELRLKVSSLENVPFATLQTWGQVLCRRVTYLLEQLVPLEQDAESQAVLVRSAPPARQPDRTLFYEVLLQAPGALSLKRYRSVPHAAGREAVDLQLTHEVLQKLVVDVIAAVPAIA